MSSPLIVIVSLLAGALLSAQGPILARLASFVGGPIQAAIVAFAIGLCALTLVAAIAGTGMPRVSGLLRMPAWAWAGGLIGTSLLVLTLYAVPRIGVTVFVAAVVCGQLFAALGYDHVGAFGVTARPVGLRELAGIVFLLGGLGLILWRDPA